MKRKSTRLPVQALKKDSKLITNKKDVANLLAETISFNSSSDHYSVDFQKVKDQLESKACNFSSDNSECYNVPFSLSELKQALLKSNSSAPGPDNIHYQMLTHLSDRSLSLLLNIFNHIWSSGSFPPSWREATVIPIPKPGKDHSDPGNYRPIALTSCLCKTMERMVYERLYWKLEEVGGLAATQCGFRKQRSTVDHLVRLESFIRDAFINKEHVVAVLFDLEKAYDTTWKHGILKDLEDLGFRGHLPIFISNFLTDRIFKVRVGSTVSDFHDQEMGGPSGQYFIPSTF
jgi:potassium voltage-gated channel Eag-related subfamily H protein 8